MKKNIWKVLLAAVLCMALVPAAVLAEEEADTLLEGFVTEILEEGFVMEDAEMGEVMLNTSEATVWDGILLENELEVGQYVVVQYDGRMTFSLPPQAHADVVGCYVLDGMVTEVFDGAFLLSGDEVFGDVYVQNVEGLAPVYANMAVKVYYDGVMTLSLPGKANAKHIVVPQLEGTVSEKTEEGFLLTDADGQQYQVFLSEETLIAEVLPQAEEAEEPAVPAEIEEEEGTTETEETTDAEEPVTAEETADEATQETAEETQIVEEVVVPEFADGDTVTVYYSGATTRSLPPQLTALEIRIHR